MTKNTTKIMLFISKSSLYFHTTMEEFQKIIKTLEKIQPFSSDIIDVDEHPELAEKYKIDALPTVIINDKRFIGQPSSEKIVEIIKGDKKKK